MSARSRTVAEVPPKGAVPNAAGTGTQFLGHSAATQELLAQLQTIAPRPATVLIEGETGVGKEIAAREIHARSRRANRPFVPVDCTAFSSQLIESQLFGHVKGAFTGAVGPALGFMRCAEGGTLLLDEIGELPLAVQAKLLRALQERSVTPIGGFEAIPIDVRVIAATHRNLQQMVRDGAFREDLFFRLNVVRITIPPLRVRQDDILPLAQHILEGIASAYEEPCKALAASAADVLVRYDWPGNVRELRNAVERAFLFAAGRTIESQHLPLEIRTSASHREECAPSDRPASGFQLPSLAESERLLIAQALKATGGNQTEAARLLAIERHRLRRKITLYQLQHLLCAPARNSQR